jgi:hypothetical protein
VVFAAVALVSCGGGHRAPSVAPAPQPNYHCNGSKNPATRAHARKRLNADLRRLRAAAATIREHTQNGNARLSSALDRFELDVAGPALPVYERSDFIDHAAAIVSPVCEQCFQDLEANRPVGAGAKLPCD